MACEARHKHSTPLLIEMIRVEFTNCYSHRIQDELGGVYVNMIDLERLKVNKKASGRYKALIDLEHLP